MLYTFYRLGRLYIASPMLFMVAMVCASTVVGLSLAVPWLLKGVLDDGLAQRQMPVLYRVGALLVAVTLVRGMVAYGQSYLTAHLAQHLAYRLRHLLSSDPVFELCLSRSRPDRRTHVAGYG